MFAVINKKDKKTAQTIAFVFVTFIFLGFSKLALAASFYFSPSAISLKPDETINVGIYVSSSDQSVNAVSGEIEFPNNVSVNGISKVDSIISFWITNPSVSNGLLGFEGLVVNPGFIGTSGKIISVSLTGKSSGGGEIIFNKGSVLANDGKGTNIVSVLPSASVFVKSGAIQLPEVDTSINNNLSAPKIYSSTNPDQNKWYSVKSPRFFWDVPSEADGIKLLAGKSPSSNPNISYEPAISEKILSNFFEGKWYLSAQFFNDSGLGSVSNYLFKLDYSNPIIKEVSFNPAITPSQIKIDAFDSISGINNYQISIDNKNFENISSLGNNLYLLPNIKSGTHNIIIKICDFAENCVDKNLSIIIPKTDFLRLVQFPQEINEGEVLVLKGTAEPESKMTIWIGRDGEDPVPESFESNKDGVFDYQFGNSLVAGTYYIWVEAKDRDGELIGTTDKTAVVVRKDSDASILGIFQGNTSEIVVASVAGLLFIVIIIMFYRFHDLRERTEKELDMLSLEVKSMHGVNEEDIEDKIKELKKIRSHKEFMFSANEILRDLKSHLADTEKAISEKMKNK